MELVSTSVSVWEAWGWVADVQHDDANGESALGLLTVALDVLVVYYIAALCNVPWRTFVLALRIDGVGGGLHVDAIGPETSEGDVEEKREDGEEDLEEP